jgi:hypothetical protein
MKNAKHHQWNLITGLVIFCINSFWIWDNLHLLYLYHYTSVLWQFMYPDWTLYVNAILAFLGFLLAVKVIRYKIKIRNAILVDIMILASGFLLKTIIVMI